MTRTIWKFTLRIADQQSIDVPVPDGEDLRVVHAGLDPAGTGVLCLWAVVDPQAPRVWRHVYIRGTGHPVPATARHVGSVVMPQFIWHVFVD